MFEKAKSLKKRLKLFLWGDSGVGKTTLALQFPKPVVLDLEGGADQYGDDFAFDVLRTVDADEIMQAVQWLGSHETQYSTVIIDPITIYWDALQRKWSDIFLERHKDKKGWKHEFYDFQPRDWMTLKSEHKAFLRRLVALDMNVVVTARQKVQYEEGSLMRVSGTTFDGEKNLPYLFDTVVQMYRDQKGRRMGSVLKDRTNTLPDGEFEIKYTVFEALFGKECLERKAEPNMIGEKQLSQIFDFWTLVPDEDKTKTFKLYGIEALEDLNREQAKEILAGLKKKYGGAFAEKSKAITG